MYLFSQTGGPYDLFFGLELLLLCGAALAASIRCRRAREALLLVAAAAAALALSHFLSSGRTLLTVGPALPGSLITRLFAPPLPAWLRRFLEPSLWLLFGGLAAAGYARRSVLLSSAAFLLLLLLFVESWSLTELAAAAVHPHPLGARAMLILHLVLIQALLMCGIIGTAAAAVGGAASYGGRMRGAAAGARPAVLLTVRIVATAAVLLLICASSGSGMLPLRAGAHYYSWFPENWNAGYLREKLEPPIPPLLGEYLSDDPKVFRQHTEWANQYGIDFFIFDWWPKRTSVDRRLRQNLDRTEDTGPLKFSLMYETGDLKEPGDAPGFDEPADAVYLTQARTERLAKHWEYLARQFMSDSRYLTIGGRAVLFVYTTRNLIGPVAEAIRQVRRHVEEQTGIQLYLVADEAYFNVMVFDEAAGARLLPELEPSWERLIAFDALTVYNPYDAARSDSAGSAGIETWLQSVTTLYRRYRGTAAAAGMPFFAAALPGYNDRGVRLADDHYVIPRMMPEDDAGSDDAGSGDAGGGQAETAPSGEKGELLFGRMLEDQVGPSLSGSLGIFLVTTFNEWNEDTQIEPTVYSPAVSRDASESGRAITQGEHYRGYEFDHLRLLLEFKQARSAGR